MDWWYPPAITTGVPATKQPPPPPPPPPESMHCPFEHVWPEGQSLLEQHWAQVPLQQSWPDAQLLTQAPLFGSHVRHWLESHGAARQITPQMLTGGQH